MEFVEVVPRCDGFSTDGKSEAWKSPQLGDGWGSV